MRFAQFRASEKNDHNGPMCLQADGRIYLPGLPHCLEGKIGNARLDDRKNKNANVAKRFSGSKKDKKKSKKLF